MKKYEAIFDLRNITKESEDNQEMLDMGIIGFIESAMMDRIGYKVKVKISICRNQGYK